MTSPLLRSAAVVGVLMLLATGPVTGSAAQAADPAAPGTSPSQQTTYDPVDDTFSLTVSPTRLVVGQGHDGEQQRVTVVNRGSAPLHITVAKRDFDGAADGTLAFSQDSSYSASGWVSLDSSDFTLAPRSSRTLIATITLPAHPEPGDHQVALVLLVPAVRSAANISINRGIGMPLYVTVPGPTDDSVALRELDAPSFSAGGAVRVTARLRSAGTVHRDFRGPEQLQLTQSGSTTRFPDVTVVRGSPRDISTTWNPPMLCVCHLTVAFPNADGTSQSLTVRVIVFPVRLVVGGILALAALAVLVVWRRKRYASQVRRAASLLAGAQ